MLQKLPKTEGDSVLLGLIVAVGIKPDKDKLTYFVTFELNGELISYELSYAYFVAFNDCLNVLLGRYEEKQIPGMLEIRFRKIKTGFELQTSGSNDFSQIYDD